MPKRGRTRWDWGLLRDIMRRLRKADRKPFKDLVRLKPPKGVGRNLQKPLSLVKKEPWLAAVVPLSSMADEDLHAVVRNTAYVGKNDRTAFFRRVVRLVHRLSQYFDVYFGRTYVRPGSEGMGVRQRWQEHRVKRRMQWGIVLGRVPMGRVKDDEILGLALIEAWVEHDVLCCNNTCMDARGPLSQDRVQVIYLVLRKRRATRR